MQSVLQISPLLGGVETLIIIMLVMAVVGFFVGRGVYRDAKSRGSNWAWQWSLSKKHPQVESNLMQLELI
jgi:hypothetical protein